MFYHLTINFKDSSHKERIYDLSKEQTKEKIHTIINKKPVFLTKSGQILLFESIESITVQSSELNHQSTIRKKEIDNNATFTDLSKPKPNYFSGATEEIIKELNFI